MLFEKTRVVDSLERKDSKVESQSLQDGGPASSPVWQSREQEKPLTCMIYFFASQMSRNLETPSAASTAASTSQQPTPPTHRLDTLLNTVRAHALHRPDLVTRFDLMPVEIPPPHPKRMPNLPKESMHDTLLLVRFKSAGAREQFINTRGWVEFMEKTDKEGVFRRIPHVRCARTVKGLRDPIEVLSV